MMNKKKFIITAIGLIVIAVIGITIYFAVHYFSLNSHVSEIKTELEQGHTFVLERTAPDKIPDEIKNLIKSPSQDNDLVSRILKKSKISTSVSFFSNTVTFRFNVSDMESFIKSLDPSAVETQELLLIAVDEYLDEGQLVTKTATLTYHKEDGQWHTNYADNNFLNAMTGGLSSGYQYLYEKMLSEYQEFIEGSGDAE